MKRVLFWSLSVLALVVLLGGAGFYLYARAATKPPEPVAVEALVSDSTVHVAANGWITFMPANVDPAAGFILYPGGFVDPRAYAPVARQIAVEGVLVAIPTMPLNLAVFDPNRADDIIEAYPEVRHWAVGGHSLGGVMAAQYAAQNPGRVDALVLWASYPPRGVDLSGSDLVVTSIYATDDGLVRLEEIVDAGARLPPTTEFVPIEGGNHAQFGSYGAQRGDLPALISAEEQQAQVAAATVDAIRRTDQ